MNVYEIITHEIIEKLNSGTIPWHKPWSGGYKPMNLVSKKEYRGINSFLLGCSPYASPYWLTFKQCSELGGRVKQGEKSTMVVFWKPLQVKDSQEEELTDKTITMLRYYRVFNTEQCSGIDKKIPIADFREDFQPIDLCERVINGMPQKPEVKHGDARAYYHTQLDYINMPPQKSFENEEFYYSVLFHELGHSTGHKDRLDRKTVTEAASFGSANYSKEELIAEMTAAFICGFTGIKNITIENSASYIAGWMKKLREDAKCVVLAAAQAQKAADFILNKANR